MSCEKNSVKCAGAAALAGISKTASKFGNVTGMLIGRLDQVADPSVQITGRVVTPLSNKILKTTDRPVTAVANVAPYLVALTAVTAFRLGVSAPTEDASAAMNLSIALPLNPGEWDWRRIQNVTRAIALLKAVKSGSSKILGDLATLTQTSEGQRILMDNRGSSKTFAANLVPRVTPFLSKPSAASLVSSLVQVGLRSPETKKGVEFAKSRLTSLINRQDVLVSHKHVVFSDGDLVRTPQIDLGLNLSNPLPTRSVTWHRGTTVIHLSAAKKGETYSERTITHLRSLTLPSQSIYFERALSDEEVAEIVTGTGKKVHEREGYVGAIGEAESLLGGWASIKRAMILARLHWPPKSPGWTVSNPQEEVSLKDALSSRKRERFKVRMAIFRDVLDLQTKAFDSPHKNSRTDSNATAAERDDVRKIKEVGNGASIPAQESMTKGTQSGMY